MACLSVICKTATLDGKLLVVLVIPGEESAARANANRIIAITRKGMDQC